MSSENSVKIFSGRALNRGRRTESRVLFGYFLHDAKSDKPFSLQRTSRFYKPRFSAQNYNFARTKLNPLPLRGSVPAGTARSACFFRRPWWHFSAAPPLFSYFLYSTKSRSKKLFRLTAVSLPGRHTSCAFWILFAYCKKYLPKIPQNR